MKLAFYILTCLGLVVFALTAPVFAQIGNPIDVPVAPARHSESADVVVTDPYFLARTTDVRLMKAVDAAAPAAQSAAEWVETIKQAVIATIAAFVLLLLETVRRKATEWADAKIVIKESEADTAEMKAAKAAAEQLMAKLKEMAAASLDYAKAKTPKTVEELIDLAASYGARGWRESIADADWTPQQVRDFIQKIGGPSLAVPPSPPTA